MIFQIDALFLSGYHIGRKKGRIAMEKLYGYRKFFAFMIFTMIVSGMLSLIPPVLLQIWSREEAALSLDKIIWVSVLLLMTNLLNAFLIFYRENFANRFNKENARSYMRCFLNMQYDKIIEEGSSNLLERIITAVTNIYLYMTGGYIQIWSSIIIAAASIVLMSQTSIFISVIMLLYIPLIFFGFKLINGELAKRSMELQTQTGAGFQELMSYIQEPDYFKQLDNTDVVIEKMNPAFDKIYNAMSKINKFAQTSSVTLSSIGTILQNIIMLYVIYSFMETRISSYMLMISTIIIPLYFEAVNSITRANINKKDYEAACDLNKMLVKYREKDGCEKIVEVKSLSIDVHKIEIAGREIHMEIKAVLKKGDIGRIYGESGSGKSSLAKSILKFRNVDNIKINGISLENISNCKLRSLTEYVSQNIPVIRGSLRDNLTFGKELCDIDDSFFINHPLLQSVLSHKSLDDEILEGGANLSGGEKQKIAIVRALLSEPQILILDEVCSNIDWQTSQEIYSMLKKDADKRITIIIAHGELPEGLINVDING